MSSFLPIHSKHEILELHAHEHANHSKSLSREGSNLITVEALPAGESSTASVALDTSLPASAGLTIPSFQCLGSALEGKYRGSRRCRFPVVPPLDGAGTLVCNLVLLIVRFD